MGTIRVIWLALAAFALAGCFAPDFVEGFTCGEGGACPQGQMCDERSNTCVKEPGTTVDGAAAIDAVPAADADPNAPDSSGVDAAMCFAFDPAHFAACAVPAPIGDILFVVTGVYTYNTSNGNLTDPSAAVSVPPSEILTQTDGSQARVLPANDIVVGASSTLRVVGNLPLILVSWSDISVAGTIDVSSSPAGIGAGSNPGSCATHAAQAGADGGNEGGGGGGGGYGGAGGNGGNGDGGSGGLGGTVVASTVIAGGCDGALGYAGTGQIGKGGGAIQLTAQVSISVIGVIHSGGGGGDGMGVGTPAGGGGGSGGYVGFDAPQVSFEATAILAANGGGGGGGNPDGQPGLGESGGPNAAAATGGSGDAPGGDGGFGGSVNGNNGEKDGTGSGAGGGGGVGYVILRTLTFVDGGAVVSPAATVMVP